MEADNILGAIGKAQRNDAWEALSVDERNEIEAAKRALLAAYHLPDHHAINARIEELNRVTMNLAENMMNTAVRGALKGTKIE